MACFRDNFDLLLAAYFWKWAHKLLFKDVPWGRCDILDGDKTSVLEVDGVEEGCLCTPTAALCFNAVITKRPFLIYANKVIHSLNHFSGVSWNIARRTLRIWFIIIVFLTTGSFRLKEKSFENRVFIVQDFVVTFPFLKTVGLRTTENFWF